MVVYLWHPKMQRRNTRCRQITLRQLIGNSPEQRYPAAEVDWFAVRLGQREIDFGYVSLVIGYLAVDSLLSQHECCATTKRYPLLVA
jgi:hypothetical protein